MKNRTKVIGYMQCCVSVAALLFSKSRQSIFAAMASQQAYTDTNY